jgi:hypothetical protein
LLKLYLYEPQVFLADSARDRCAAIGRGRGRSTTGSTVWPALCRADELSERTYGAAFWASDEPAQPPSYGAANWTAKQATVGATIVTALRSSLCTTLGAALFWPQQRAHVRASA